MALHFHHDALVAGLSVSSFIHDDDPRAGLHNSFQ